MVVHVVDGTYELFRHFYGLRRFNKGKDRPYGAVMGVLQTVLQMIEGARLTSVSPPITSSNRFAIASMAGLQDWGWNRSRVVRAISSVGGSAGGNGGGGMADDRVGG